MKQTNLTFKSLPFKGKTPNRERPRIGNPEIANAFAESPSVRIRVHSLDFEVPAHSASSNLLIARYFFFVFPPPL
jgi:hypothetical protein